MRRTSDLVPVGATVRSRMQRQRERSTSPELALRRALYRLGMRYRVNARVPSLKRTEADVLFTSAKVAVFVDGCFWHRCPLHATFPKHNADFWREKLEANAARDRRTDDRLAEIGWLSMRFWEHEDQRVAALQVRSQVLSRRSGQAGTSSSDGCQSVRDERD